MISHADYNIGHVFLALTSLPGVGNIYLTQLVCMVTKTDIIHRTSPENVVLWMEI